MLQNPSGSNTLQRCMNPGLCLASRGDPVGAPRYGGYRVPASTRAWLGDTRRATSSRKYFLVFFWQMFARFRLYQHRDLRANTRF